MVKIAFTLDSDGNLASFADYPSSLYQDTSKGWIIVEDDPAFLIAEKFNWTIRQSDNVLVHKSTGMTPDEEHKDALTQLTLQNLQLSKSLEDVKGALTESTKQNLSLTADNIQLKKDREDLQSAITNLTKEVIEIKSQSVSNTETAPETTSTENGGN